VNLVPSTDPILHVWANPVTDIPGQVLPHLAEMREILEAHPEAAGLAAPQVGLSLRFFLFRERAGLPFVLAVNPDFVAGPAGGRVSKPEGCLTYPGRTAYAVRWNEINAGWTSKRGHRTGVILTGLRARVFQHELDHLDGKTIFDP